VVTYPRRRQTNQLAGLALTNQVATVEENIMKKIGLVAALCVLALSGCATRLAIPKLDVRKNPEVSVSGNTVQVPAVLYFFPGETNVEITWRLPEGQGLAFPENGILIEGALTDKVLQSGAGSVAVILDGTQKEISCPKQRGGLTFVCTNLNSKPGVYKYTIRVLRKGEALPPRDPPIVNMP
jgi:hypothetical protein